MKELSNQVVTVGPARRVPRSRIWLQGKRLTQAHFAPGLTFGAKWHKNGTLELLLGPAKVLPEGYEVRTVSGKGDVPVIDITGARVRDTFTAGFVEVSFYAGRIVIREAQ